MTNFNRDALSASTYLEDCHFETRWRMLPKYYRSYSTIKCNLCAKFQNLNLNGVQIIARKVAIQTHILTDIMPKMVNLFSVGKYDKV